MIFEEELEYLNDWLGLPENEGTSLTTYIPINNREAAKDSKSGVTIAKGYDLGQVSAKQLKSLGLSDKTVKALLPFVGLKGEDAWDKFKEADKVTITAEEEELITEKVTKPVLRELKKKFGDDRWNFMSDGMKKVAYAARVQYGSKFYKQNAFKQIKNNDVDSLKNNLTDWGDKTKDTGPAINNRYSRYVELDFASPVVEGDIESGVIEGIQEQLKASETGQEVSGLTPEEEAELARLDKKFGNIVEAAPSAAKEKVYEPVTPLTEEEEAELERLNKKFGEGVEYKGPAYKEKPDVKSDFDLQMEIYG